MTTHKFIKFTGDYSKLKSMGYEFQALYASNYMQWSKASDGEWSPTTRVWKKGTEVTMDALTNYEGTFFELYMDYKNRGEELPWHTCNYLGKSTYLRVITNNTDHSVTFDYDTYVKQEKANHRAWDRAEKAGIPTDEIPDDEFSHDLQSVVLSAKTLTALDEFIKLGWVELGTIEVPD